MLASSLSNIGSQMTVFALVAWAYETTGSAASAGLLGTASYGAMIVASLFAGTIVDRMDRKKLLIVTDLIGMLTTGALFLLAESGTLATWSLVASGVLRGLIGSVQFPAYLSGIMGMVPDEEKPRANGLFQMSYSLTVLVGPPLAGSLLGVLGLTGVLLIDLASFVVILLTTLTLPIPKLAVREKKQSVLRDTWEGVPYLARRPLVIGSVLALTSVNVAFGAYEGLYRPMLLAMTEHSESIAGWALASYGVGNVVSGILMSVWKGPKNRVPLMLIGWALMSLSGFVVGGLGRSLPVWIVAGFGQGVLNNIAVVLTMGIWQTSVEPEYQGRAFSLFKLVGQITIPLSMFAATQAADRWAEPAMQGGGALAGLLGPWFGTMTGAGMSLVLVAAGLVFGALVPLLLLMMPAVRRMDAERTGKRKGAIAA
jgi:MFS transporter, DHA3 family, macrolide efflux protein